jgi:hypothetical protein
MNAYTKEENNMQIIITDENGYLVSYFSQQLQEQVLHNGSICYHGKHAEEIQKVIAIDVISIEENNNLKWMYKKRYVDWKEAKKIIANTLKRGVTHETK